MIHTHSTVQFTESLFCHPTPISITPAEWHFSNKLTWSHCRDKLQLAEGHTHIHYSSRSQIKKLQRTQQAVRQEGHPCKNPSHHSSNQLGLLLYLSLIRERLIFDFKCYFLNVLTLKDSLFIQNSLSCHRQLCSSPFQPPPLLCSGMSTRSLSTDEMLQCICTRGTRSHWAPATSQGTRISTLISIVSNLMTIPRQKYGNQGATYPGWKRAQIQSLDFHHSLTMVDAREMCWIKGNWNLNIPFTKITLTSKVLFF